MIQHLIRYYDNYMPEDAKIPYGYSKKEISFVIEIDEDGNILQNSLFIDLRNKDGKGITFNVPDDYVPDNGFLPRFLYGRIGYMFHTPDKKGKFSWFEGQQKLHLNILQPLADEGYRPAIAVLNYFDKEIKNVRKFTEDELTIYGSALFTFRFEGKYLFQDERIKAIWEKSLEHGISGISAFSGKEGLILEDPHPKFGSSVVPGTGAGGTLVSRKKEVSAYQMEMPLPSICKEDVYKYKSALVYLMTEKEKRKKEVKEGNKDKKPKKITEDGTIEEKNDEYTHYFYRTKLTDNLTILHWAEVDKPIDYDPILGSMDNHGQPFDNNDLKTLFERVCKGAGFSLGEQNPVVHIFSIFGQQGRIRVVFASHEFMNDILQNALSHQEHIRLVGMNKTPSLYMLLNSLLPDGSNVNQYQNLVQGLVLSIMTGVNYPESLYIMALEKIKTGIVSEKLSLDNYTTRAIISLLKAIMIKNYNMEVSDKMNELEKNTAYLLGRVYAAAWLTVSKDHRDNMTKVMERWYRVAMESPAMAYAPYLQSVKIHGANDYKIASIMKEITEPLPERLSVKEQGLWTLGFYHQYASQFKIGEIKEEKTGSEMDDAVKETIN